jgi:hypothetical protein
MLCFSIIPRDPGADGVFILSARLFDRHQAGGDALHPNGIFFSSKARVGFETELLRVLLTVPVADAVVRMMLALAIPARS